MSDPLHTPTMLLKNTLNIKTPGGDNTPGERTRYFPRRLLQDSENDPPTSMISPSKFAVVRQLINARHRGPLEDHDTNSQDSGISEDSKSSSDFRFAEPWGAAPRRLSSLDISSPLRLRSPKSTLLGTPDRAVMSPRVRHSKLPDASPKRSLIFSSDSATSLSSFSSESTDDGFLDLFQNEKLADEDAQMSGSRLGNLLSAQILTNSTPPRSPPRRNNNFQRSLSENISPNKTDVFTLKRPLLLSSYSIDATTPVSKKHKPLGSQDLNVVQPHERGTLFQYGFKKSSSLLSNSGLLSPPHSITPEPTSPPRATTPSTSSEHSIKLGFQRSTTEELIGDFSGPFALPLISARQEDLKTITSDTLAKLVQGEFADNIASFKIIDCRYPYEYEGGHIKGAVNLYRKDQITQELHTRQRENSAKLLSRRSKKTKNLSERSCEETLAVSLSDDVESNTCLTNERTCLSPGGVVSPSKESDSETEDVPEGRNILIFHCEYSLERGPALYRCLRKEDRHSNPYPKLTYPELYLLEGGYKSFFTSFSDLCEPQAYKPMKHPEHTQDLHNFRAKSKSWSGKHHKKLSVRNLSRL